MLSGWEIGRVSRERTAERLCTMDIKTRRAVPPPMLLQLWEACRKAGFDMFDSVSEANLRSSWRSLVGGSTWTEVEISDCLMAAREMLRKDGNVKNEVLGDGSMIARLDRWLHFILVGFSLPRVRSTLEQLWHLLQDTRPGHRAVQIGADTEMLHKLHLAVATRDTDRERCWQVTELLEICDGLHRMEYSSHSSPSSFVNEMLTGLCLRGDEYLSYTEFLALFFGRVEADVVMCMYDLSRGAAKVMNLGDGIWHTSVEVFGWEYFYTGNCVYCEPGHSAFGKPTKKVRVGSTLCRRSELHNFCVGQLALMFTSETYDVVRNNCNHFSDKLLYFLCKGSVPHDVVHQLERLPTWITNILACQRLGEVRDEGQMEFRIDSRDCKEPKFSFAHERAHSHQPKVTEDDVMELVTDSGGERSDTLSEGDSILDLSFLTRGSQNAHPITAFHDDIILLQQSMADMLEEEDFTKARPSPSKKRWSWSPFSSKGATVSESEI